MVIAYAHTNIAVVKYWGKRPGPLNLPAVGSVSLTLREFGTETRVEADGALNADMFELNGKVQDGLPLKKVSTFLDLVRARSGDVRRARVVSRNDVPTAAGLASSASAFAALAVAGARAFGLHLSTAELSSLARQGSGSAARSVEGGFVRLHKGAREDGTDCFAEQVAAPDAWDVRLVVAHCAEGPKDVASTDGMNLTMKTSPFFAPWVETHEADIADAVAAIHARDLPRLGEVMEFNTLKMHASGMAARPGVLYWRGVSVEAMHAVKQLRQAGVGAWFTMDAGPHVKVLCATADAERVHQALSSVPGVLKVQVASPGPSARVLP